MKGWSNWLMLVVILVSSADAVAQFWGAKYPRPAGTSKDSLKKGDFTWAPQIAPAGPIVLMVSLDEQLAFTYRNGVLIGMATVSTGKKGYETPTGVFVITLKDANHHSSIYNNASMPFTERFTNSGIALHAGGLPGYPSSHGCVHLPSEYARLLFNETSLGMTVVVTSRLKSPEEVDHPGFLSPVLAGGKIQPHERLSATEKYRWQPNLSDKGPVTMLASRTDQRLVILRNGIEIGRCKISIANQKDSIGTFVCVAHEKDSAVNKTASPVKWVMLPLADHNYGSDNQGDYNKRLKRIDIPDEFLKEISDAFVPGTTLMVTDAPILTNNKNSEMAVVTSHPG